MNKFTKYFDIQQKSFVSDNPDWELVFKARPSTEDLDFYDEITNSDAFMAAMPDFMKNPVAMFNHHMDWTIGKTIEYSRDDKSPLVTIGISKTEKGKEVATLIRDGVVSKMSFMFGDVQYEEEEGTGIKRLTKFKIYEIGPVSIPANMEAVIEEVKNRNLKLLESYLYDEGTKTRKVKGMDAEVKKVIEQYDERLKNIDTVLDSQKSLVDGLKTNITSRDELIKIVEEKAKDAAKGLMTEADFKQQTDAITSQILELTDKIEKATNVQIEQKTLFPINDWRGMSKDYVWLKDENGKALEPFYQKMFGLLRAPVDMKSNEGRVVKLMRECSDALLLSYAMGQKKNPTKPLKSYKAFQDFVQFVKYFDPDLAKSLSGDNTGYGAEWVPQMWSAELFHLAEIEPSIVNIFKVKEIATSSQKFYRKTSNVSAYKYGAANTDNPDTYKRSKFQTEDATYATEGIAVNVPVDSMLVEDSVFDIVQEVRQDSAKALVRAKKNIIVNGDTTATHRDTNQGYVANESPETLFMGLKFTAIDDSKTFDTQSTTAGIGDGTAAYHEKDSRYLNNLITPAFAVEPGKCHKIVNVATWLQMKSFEAMQDASRNGIKSTWGDGKLDSIDGNTIHLTDAIPKTLNTTGVDDGSNPNHSVEIHVHEDGFKRVQTRAAMVEYDKDVQSGLMSFVTHERWGFKRVAHSSEYPVAMGLNIETP